MRHVSQHELAELELNDAADFYNSKLAGLGSSFILEVQQAVLQIKGASRLGKNCEGKHTL